MAFSKDQTEPVLPAGASTKRTAVDFLPRYFRTNTNKKFLNATIDQMISEGQVDKINAFLGRKTAPAHNISDRYLTDVSDSRSAYQLEPAVVIRDNLDNVTFFKDYNDYINQLNFFNINTADHSKINSQEYYAWEPHINWDKFVNYREYYWLPNGPQAIAIVGQSTTITSTYTVSLVDDGDNKAYVFTPNGLTRNPTIKLYRGQTYIFEIDCPGAPISFKTDRNVSDSYTYTSGIVSTSPSVEKGTITFTVPVDAPNLIYYISDSDINTSGFFKIYDIEDSTEIDVENEIIGKKTYSIGSGIELSNGMKIYFQGQVTPAQYAEGNWYVEGVGDKITLVSENSLEAPAPFTTEQTIEFDSEKFDTQGFDVNSNYLATKDYVTINRSSKDRNHWSRYNRWFHKDVIEASAIANEQPVSIDQTARATRPIIEFNANLQLWNFGRQAKKNVDLVDTYTTDVFSTIEGSIGYNIDGVNLVTGMRVLFTADTDVTVSGRIYKVKFITHLGQKRLTLVAEDDTNPIDGESVLVTNGKIYQGSMFHYTNNLWYLSQNKTTVNQEPLFDIFDISGISYGDRINYVGSNFSGTKLFSYATGTTYDPELKKYIKYQNVGNIGDIVFDFNLHSDTFNYQNLSEVLTRALDTGYLRLNYDLSNYAYKNGWVTAVQNSVQPVVRQYDVVDQFNFYEIDVYDRSGDLTDLGLTVYVNQERKNTLEYEIYRQNGIAYVQLYTDTVAGDVVIIEATSSAPKTSQGYYKFPSNLESNPENLSLTTLTLGQINNHVKTITDNFPLFTGKFPGVSNLRDTSNLSPYGTRVIQHSAPLPGVIYHLTNKDLNVIKSLRYAQEEYSKFKRNLIRVATSNSYTGITKTHLDLILAEVNKDKPTESPFYLSDTLPYGANIVYDQNIIDDSFTDYPLTFDFDLVTPSQRAVLVYINDEILVHDRDYKFINTSFVRILKSITTGDNLKIVQYETTAGCCIPPTPTKLGLYPAYEPKIYIDNTYQTPTKVIQGHDGSIVVAFSKWDEPNEYRDELILEFETRIYNNIKVKYNPEIFNINEFVGGYYRSGDVTTQELDNALRQEFLRWSTLISDDYTKHTFFDRENTSTFNYKEFITANDTLLKGFWRGIFKQFYDTDRPHTHPWEMLGFSIEPTWWQDVYGPAPYTKNNLILWQDLAEGNIREPGKIVVKNALYARPTLLSIVPVDESGNLLDPITAGLVKDFNPSLIESSFTFGDHAPVENAWRRSSNYPFALITALTLLRPAKVFATCFDRVRQYRDSTEQLVYKSDNGNLRFTLNNIVYPATVKDSAYTFTSGLVNYIVSYAISKSFEYVDSYKLDLERLQIKIASKLAGFTSKEKFKLILDSRSPLNQGNVFIPEENYDIVLNVSTPVLSISYSGVIIEKQSSGFIIKGYNLTTPEFKYYPPAETASDPVVNIGGISESFVEWSANKVYTNGQIVKADLGYYRVTIGHTSSSLFEDKYFAKLPALPITGGRDIILRRRFKDNVESLHYGAELLTVQDVIDFLLGYGRYLESMGFVFEFYNPVLQTVTDWQSSAKEFAFWTTQNWAAGSVITLSPSADELIFKKTYAVVDNIYDNFYEYSVFKQDGIYLDQSFTNKVRENNSFSLRPQDTADGIYHVTLNLVQKEHVLILDDKTVFNDIIYDQTQGYRQDRIKAVGYRMANWNGDFNIPGFIYDRALVTEWAAWTDYSLGETVKYKEFYYSAKQNVPGSELFDEGLWFKLSGRPTSGLLPNWDYRANQFADFYDLDTDSFDVSQQQFSQHLIGYQKRKYLENIINDDVSQYKFYQGMIQEKGTKNSLSKLFDVLSSVDKESLEFYEEWAIRLGQYGATAGFEEIEYILDEAEMLINPQPFELVASIDKTINDFVYRITPDKVYVKPDNYSHNPFPTELTSEEYIPTPGYVHLEDIKQTVRTKDDLLTLDFRSIVDGDYFWVGFERNTWDVYRFTLFATRVRSLTESGDNLRITLNGPRSSDDGLDVGNTIGINNTNPALESLHKIVAVGLNYFEVVMPTTLDSAAITALNDNLNVNIFKFTSQRLETTPTKVSTIDDINTLPLSRKKNGELVWIDGDEGNWAVWKFTKTFESASVSALENNFGKSFSLDKLGTVLAVGSDNKVTYYSRPTNKFDWVYSAQITPSSTNGRVDTYNSFGNFVSINSDGSYLFISAPNAGTITTPGATPFDPVITTPTNYGYVAQYTRDPNGNYIFTRIIEEPTLVVDSRFGYKTQVADSTLYVVSQSSETTPATIYSYNLINNVFVSSYEFAENVQVTDLTISENKTVVVATTDGIVTVLTPSLVQLQTIDKTAVPLGIVLDETSAFAQSAAISLDAQLLAIGAPKYTNKNIEQGAVILYELTSAGYEPFDYLLSPVQQQSEQFGHNVRFNDIADRLVVYSYGGNQTIESTFDTYSETFATYTYRDRNGNTKISQYVNDPNSLKNENVTTYDLGATRIVDTQEFVGNVRVYENYNNKFLYADELEVPAGALGINYGSTLVATDKIYIEDSISSRGAVHEFSSADRSWSIFRRPEKSVKIDKIKSAFLYNTKTNQIIQQLDYVDPVKGKILGIAEQELKFKTYFDPATYSIGTEDVVVDELMSWKELYVGRLWWDLSTVKFINANQGSTLYKANSWNNLYDGATVDIYEWVESEYRPSEWDSLADTETGLTLGISGTSRYGDLAYCLNQKFDTVSQTFKSIYYFWVKNKNTVPEVEFRKISASEVSDLITDPKSKGIRYVSFLGSNQFALVNCKEIISSTEIAINFRYWTIENTEINIHSHYQLLAEGDTYKGPNKYIEQKWFDSLIGHDISDNQVPDPRLPVKLRYGILNKPRQGMFINRIEALKQFIERTNSVLINKLIIDDFDISTLNSKDEVPSILTNRYDIAVDTASEIRFVSSSGFAQASAVPIIEDGKIVRVLVTNAGRGYKISPEIKITGTGSGAILQSVIDNQGKVTAITVINPGRDYQQSALLSIRPFTILVTADENASGKWSLYTWNPANEGWFRAKTQVYDVTKHWEYVDWYANGYNSFTKIDFVVDFAYELNFKDIQIGDIVKINNEKSGGWILLEKVDNLVTNNTTINYKTVGRENGTIQFKSNLYKFEGSTIGYDSITYDSDVYDDEPKEELRIILNCIKNNLFVDELLIEYNKLFFASLRYVFTEQPFVDWAFKTSFVKSRHNLGTLEQHINYRNDNLESYEQYINEVKPYRTKVREFVSTYDKLDQTRTAVTDFDLPPVYDIDEEKILPFVVTVKDSTIEYNNNSLLSEPYVDWYRNVGYEVVSIEIIDGGNGYQAAPGIEIVGDSTDTATAKAYVSQGRITKIVITNPGSGYLTTPSVVINGGVGTNGREARLSIILGKGNVRSIFTGMKFDRLSPKFQITNLKHIQTFSGSGSKTRFNLTWPIDVKTDKTLVTVDGNEMLSGDFRVYNVLDKTASYKRYNSVLEFSVAPSSTSAIIITYHKDINLLDAADRIQHYYLDPQPGQLGQDLGQLMLGVDYGGVEVTGIKFNIGSGWDALPWFTSGWDDFDSTYTDLLKIADGVTFSYNLNYVPLLGEQINVYWQGIRNSIPYYIRLDDPYYDEYTDATTTLSAKTSELSLLQTQLTTEQETLVVLQQDRLLILEDLSDANVLLEFYEAELNADPTNPILQDQYDDQVAIISGIQTTLLNKNQEINSTQLAINATQADIVLKEAEVDAAQLIVNNLVAQDRVVTNPHAVMNSYIGDGTSAGPIEIPSAYVYRFYVTATQQYQTYTLDAGDKIILRKSTSDGSFKPNEKFYDSEIIGGDFTYTTARGLRAEEIKIDGDGFVTPMTSHAPEEVVPGQVTDTVDITVYHKVTDGAPILVTRHYIANGTDAQFSIGQQPGNIRAVFVKVAGEIKEQDTDYTVDFIAQEVTLLTPPSNNTEVVVTSMSRNGNNVIDADFFIGDGSTTKFITVARWSGEYTAIVTINGEETTVTTFIADDTYTNLKFNIGLEFSVAPADGAIINYTILNGTINTISKVDEEIIAHDGTTTLYPLTKLPLYKKPYENNMLVQFNGKVLRPADTIYFEVVGASRTYSVSSNDYLFNSIDPNAIKVYLNGNQLSIAKDFSWVSSLNQLKIKRGVAVSGDKISLVIIKEAEYEVIGEVPNLSIKLLGTYAANDKIIVTTFTNHDILDIERNNNYFILANQPTPGTIEYYSLNQLLAGRIALRNPTIGAQYVWLSLNGELLTPEIDYILEDNRKFIRLDPKRELLSTDVIEVVAFNSQVTEDPFAYKIFKDSLNRTYYKRIDDSVTTTLAQELNYYDLEILVVNSTGLAEPLRSQNRPGVVMINGERIEYFTKRDNKLGQLRRGTLGTGIPAVHPISSTVRDQGTGQTIPYKDEIIDTVYLTDGTTNLIPLDFVPTVAVSTVALNNTWYRNTIPSTHGQSDEIEVFVAGKRLRKAPTTVWNSDVGPDSPTGDIQVEAEFAVDGTSASILLTTMPPAGVVVKVQKRVGRVWSPFGTSITKSMSDQAKFIRSAPALLPGTLIDKYDNSGATANTILLENGSGPILGETGNPLELE